MRSRVLLLAALLAVFAQADMRSQPATGAPTLDPALYQDLRYRLIGPFRASRTVGAVGIPTQPECSSLA